jgi:hypothetical protein
VVVVLVILGIAAACMRGRHRRRRVEREGFENTYLKYKNPGDEKTFQDWHSGVKATIGSSGPKQPFNRNVMTKNLKSFKSVLDRYGIFFWLGEGTALGAIREGQIIENDGDVDVGIYEDDEYTFLSEALPELIHKKQFILGRFTNGYKNGPLTIIRNGQYIDVDIYGKNRTCFAAQHWPGGNCTPVMNVLKPFDKAYIGNHEYNVPSMEYIIFLYGKNWRIPDGSHTGFGDTKRGLKEAYNTYKHWKFNKEFDVIKWEKGMTYEDYKQQNKHNKNLKRVSKWCDKIWLLEWYKQNNIRGPDVIHYSRDVDDISPYISSLKEYCIKPSHLDSSQGVLVVKDGEIQELQMSMIKDYPDEFKKYKSGYKINAKEVNELMQYLKTLVANWGDWPGDEMLFATKPGIVIEKLWERPKCEFKIFVVMGEVWDYYLVPQSLHSKYNKGPKNKRFGDKKKCGTYKIDDVFELAEKVGVASGVDFVRVDIILDKNGTPRVNEFTWNPSLDHVLQKKDTIDKRFHELVDWHLTKK